MNCNCTTWWKGRVVHTPDCGCMDDFFFVEHLLEEGLTDLHRRRGETVDEFIQRVLRAWWGVYYPWRNTDETGSD